MAGLAKAYVSVMTDLSGLKTGLGKAQAMVISGTERMSAGFGRVQKAVFSVRGAIMATGGALAASKLVSELGRTVEAASRLQEVTSKYETVFRDQMAVANQFTDELRSGYAMSTREAREHLGAIQDLLVPMGMASDAAAVMSGEATKLAADLGSFNDLPTAQVLDNIKSALVGEYEPMRKYGVVLNTATVAQKALNIGLANSVKELTAADKAQAAYKLIVEGSKAAIGDMARTSGSYANVIKGMKSRLEEAAAAIGKVFIPYATAAAKKVSEFAGILKDNSAVITSWVNVLWDGAIYTFGELWDAVKMAWDLLAAVPKGALDFMNNLSKETAGATKEMKGLGDALEEIKAPEPTGFQRLWAYMGALGRSIVDVFTWAGKSVGALFGVMVGDAWDTAVAIGKAFHHTGNIMWGAMTLNIDLVRSSWDKLKNTGNTYMEDINANWGAFTTTVADSYNTMAAKTEEYWNAAAQYAKGGTDALKGAQQEAVEAVKEGTGLMQQDLKDVGGASEEAAQEIVDNSSLAAFLAATIFNKDYHDPVIEDIKHMGVIHDDYLKNLGLGLDQELSSMESRWNQYVQHANSAQAAAGSGGSSFASTFNQIKQDVVPGGSWTSVGNYSEPAPAQPTVVNNVTVSPTYMTGDSNAAQAVARDIRDELENMRKRHGDQSQFARRR